MGKKKTKRKLMFGDCLKRMKELETNSIDMCLTDPPYGTSACKWDSVIPFESMWAELKRIVKDDGAICLFGGEPFSSHLRLSNIKMFKYDWVWKKSNPSGIANSKIQPLRYHEYIHCFYLKNRYYPQKIPRLSSRIKQGQKTNYFFKTVHGSENDQCKGSKGKHAKTYDKDLKMPSTILEFNSLRANSKEWCKHPTQKPVALLEYLIKTYTLEKETILDFTMGSGSTGVACKNLNRGFIGIENNKEYFKTAKQRIKEINGKP